MINKNRIEQVLAQHALTVDQEKAVMARGKDVIVTAGAGSGKTRTLVARYISFLAEGFDPQEVVAITFTDKAAREMRNRVRDDLQKLKEGADSLGDEEYWRQLINNIDGARIGTIHGLCAEILRNHPAEAGIDPEFIVLEEGVSKLYMFDAVGRALAWAVEREEFQPLFSAIKIKTIEKQLDQFVEKRLDFFGKLAEINPRKVLFSALSRSMELSLIGSNIEYLKELQSTGELSTDAEGLSDQLYKLIDEWEKIVGFLEEGSLLKAVKGLFFIRRKLMGLQKGPRSGSVSKEALKEIRDAYDEYINPWIGGKDTKDLMPNQETEHQFLVVLPLFIKVLNFALADYKTKKDQERALDFDDLEYMTRVLTQKDSIQSIWQARISHILVDEFQDTNQRQRDIVLALAGNNEGRLFFVGDAQQSIYRFRGADVEVFVSMHDEIKRKGGDALQLNTSFRSHQPMVDSLDALLGPVIGTDKKKESPYSVPYLPMKSFTEQYEGNYKPAYVDFILGIGNAEEGRENSATALADRLIAMKKDGEIQSWDEVALLFRASTGYSSYEDAFSKANIPFVTVSGRGFYDRPEIRDLLNILIAISNPWDDAAMTGFLRSPSIGLKDSDIYLLRVDEIAGTQPLYSSLREYKDLLPEGSHKMATWAIEVLETFVPLANHIVVADLLAKIIDYVSYRAIMMGSGPRAVRNINKLLEDARESKILQVSVFLEYLSFLRESGVRSGEAVSEAQDSVQLKTIHKSKGLEFPLVVLADAGRSQPADKSFGIFLSDTGMTLNLDRLDQKPMLFNHAKMINKNKEDAEILRLLYVACTRVQEKLLISGHINKKGKGKGFLDLIGIDYTKAIDNMGNMYRADGGGVEFDFIVHNSETISRLKMPAPATLEQDQTPGKSLIRSLIGDKQSPEEQKNTDDENSYINREWQATGSHYAPAVVVGSLVHKAIQRWVFPGSDGYLKLMKVGLAKEGIVNPKQESLVMAETTELLNRFSESEIFQEIESAEISEHEVPYIYQIPGKKLESGIIDLLYYREGRWFVLDFKTDEIKNDSELLEKVNDYKYQLSRYRKAVKIIKGFLPQTRIFFLNYIGKARLVDVTKQANNN